jgi:hypothetical protein
MYWSKSVSMINIHLANTNDSGKNKTQSIMDDCQPSNHGCEGVRGVVIDGGMGGCGRGWV